MGLCPPWAFVCHCTGSSPTTKDKGCWATVAFTTTSLSLCTALIASRVPRLYNTASLFTMRLSKVTMPFKLHPQCEGSPCCLSRRAGQHLGVGGRDSRSRFTWDHVNTTPHTRSTSPSGSSRTTTALLPRRKVHHHPFDTTREHHTQYNPHYTHHNPTTSYHHVWAGQHRLRIRPAVRP